LLWIYLLILGLFLNTTISSLVLALLARRPLVEWLAVAHLIDELVVSEGEMGFTNLKTTELADVVSHGINAMLWEVLLCNGLVRRLIVPVRELLHFVLHHSLLLLGQRIAGIERHQPILKELVTEIVVIRRCVLNATRTHVKFATPEVLLGPLGTLVHGEEFGLEG
jgi:hypothetical protein